MVQHGLLQQAKQHTMKRQALQNADSSATQTTSGAVLLALIHAMQILVTRWLIPRKYALLQAQLNIVADAKTITSGMVQTALIRAKTTHVVIWKIQQGSVYQELRQNTHADATTAISGTGQSVQIFLNVSRQTIPHAQIQQEP